MGKKISIEKQQVAIYNDLKKARIIDTFRKGWKMPIEGFLSIEDFENWERTALARMALDWKDKQNDDQRRSMSKENKRIREPIFKINCDIYDILRRFKLPEHYFYYVTYCLCLTKPPFDLEIKAPLPEVVVERNPDTKQKELWVRVFAHTTKKDWDRTWHWEIEDKQTQIIGYKASVKKVHESLYNLHEAAKAQGRRLTNKQLMTIAFRRYGYKVASPRDISTILSRVRKRFEK